MSEGVTITIPKELYFKLKQKISNSELFTSVDAYVSFILNEVLEDNINIDEDTIKARLKDLGYI
jgi:hypothetical protein